MTLTMRMTRTGEQVLNENWDTEYLQSGFLPNGTASGALSSGDALPCIGRDVTNLTSWKIAGGACTYAAANAEGGGVALDADSYIISPTNGGGADWVIPNITAVVRFQSPVVLNKPIWNNQLSHINAAKGFAACWDTSVSGKLIVQYCTDGSHYHRLYATGLAANTKYTLVVTAGGQRGFMAWIDGVPLTENTAGDWGSKVPVLKVSPGKCIQLGVTASRAGFSSATVYDWWLFSQQLSDAQIADLIIDPHLPARPECGRAVGGNPIYLKHSAGPSTGRGKVDGFTGSFDVQWAGATSITAGLKLRVRHAIMPDRYVSDPHTSAARVVTSADEGLPITINIEYVSAEGFFTPLAGGHEGVIHGVAEWTDSVDEDPAAWLWYAFSAGPWRHKLPDPDSTAQVEAYLFGDTHTGGASKTVSAADKKHFMVRRLALAAQELAEDDELDILVYGGDGMYANSGTPEQDAVALARLLRHAGVIACTGNHDNTEPWVGAVDQAAALAAWKAAWPNPAPATYGLMANAAQTFGVIQVGCARFIALDVYTYGLNPTYEPPSSANANDLETELWALGADQINQLAGELAMYGRDYQIIPFAHALLNGALDVGSGGTTPDTYYQIESGATVDLNGDTRSAELMRLLQLYGVPLYIAHAHIFGLARNGIYVCSLPAANGLGTPGVERRRQLTLAGDKYLATYGTTALQGRDQANMLASFCQWGFVKLTVTPTSQTIEVVRVAFDASDPDDPTTGAWFGKFVGPEYDVAGVAPNCTITLPRTPWAVQAVMDTADGDFVAAYPSDPDLTDTYDQEAQDWYGDGEGLATLRYQEPWGSGVVNVDSSHEGGKVRVCALPDVIFSANIPKKVDTPRADEYAEI